MTIKKDTTKTHVSHEIVEPKPVYKTVYQILEYHKGLSTPRERGTFISEKNAQDVIPNLKIANPHATFKIIPKKVRVV